MRIVLFLCAALAAYLLAACDGGQNVYYPCPDSPEPPAVVCDTVMIAGHCVRSCSDGTYEVLDRKHCGCKEDR